MPVIVGSIFNNQDSQLHRIIEAFRSAWVKWHVDNGGKTGNKGDFEQKLNGSHCVL
jgi:hypothetical protein